MRILVFGKTGQVGCGLSKDLESVGSVRCVGRDEVDLGDLASIETTIQHEHPDIVVNAAAYTNVDQAESEVKLANLINIKAPGVMAEMAAAGGAWFIHYSTDYVFDGECSTPYTEDMTRQPINVYGTTKSRGEDAVIKATTRYLIIRTSWVYSNRGRNFLNTVLRLANERRELRIVNDQTGTPTYSRALSTNTANMIKKLSLNWDDPDMAGIFNMTCRGATTWYEFAREILKYAGIEHVAVEPISTSEFPTLAKRPQYSVLDNAKLEHLYGLRLPRWQDSLKECLAQRAI
jgi:dTDP-4-dehydrorhamnose reductase